MHDYSSENQQSLVEVIEEYFAFLDGSAGRDLGDEQGLGGRLERYFQAVREPLKSGSTIVGVVTNAEQLLANLRAQLAL